VLKEMEELKNNIESVVKLIDSGLFTKEDASKVLKRILETM
jgi:hypothetical protein